MPDFLNINVPSPRPLPVIILADVSGSMDADGKIQSLNLAISEMIKSFAEEKNTRVEIYVAVIIFGNSEAKLHIPITSVNELAWHDMEAKGKTPLGSALTIARELLEDKEQISGKSYTPSLVLISDGQPTDDWEDSLTQLISSSRASKSERFAISIGPDADIEMLARFITNQKVFKANEARQIQEFFRLYTMSVTKRIYSKNPNEVNDASIVIGYDENEDF